jgi:aspartyl-tRNA(Asn)/glutamyl-tRNA(Gln) amidotransferase subunit B
MKDFELVIWLEIHVRINSETKLFCNCKNAVELASEPNVNACSVCMWFPGMLPVLNKEAVRKWALAGLAMKCSVNNISKFDRKSYFYPDLPMGYQITQLYEPIVSNWKVKIIDDGEIKEFGIHHMHLENDAGKLIHAWWKTLCDYNRAGSPLMEIVTEPDFRSKAEVMEFVRELQKMMRAVGVSNADMEKGQMRCDVNISIRKPWEDVLNNRVELKNLNSPSAIWRAIDNEFKRQVKIVSEGGIVDQETRWWDDEKGMSKPQRSKEDAMDYRYFPDPDLLPLEITDEEVAEIAKDLVELPIEKRIKYLEEYKLQEDDARLLTTDRDLSLYFEKLLELTNDAKKSCSYITTILMALMKESEDDIKITDLKFDIEQLARVIELVNKDELSSTNSKDVVEALFKKWGKADEIIDQRGLRQTNDTGALEQIVDEVIANYTEQVEDYKSGNERVFGFLVGQCMKASKGQWNPKIFNEMLKNKLD